jgi:ribosomal protein S27E
MGNQVQIIFDKSQISILKRCARCGARLDRVRWGTNPVTGKIERICKKCLTREERQFVE